MSDDRTLRIERTYEAPIEAVFEAWTSEDVLRRWWHTEDGYQTSEASSGEDALTAVRGERPEIVKCVL